MLQPECALGLPLFLLHHAAVLRVDLAASQQTARLWDKVCEMDRLQNWSGLVAIENSALRQALKSQQAFVCR
jgi:hypothetical protein